MQVPRSAFLGFGIFGALVLGWMLHGLAGGGAAPGAATAATPIVPAVAMRSPEAPVFSPDVPLSINVLTGGFGQPEGVATPRGPVGATVPAPPVKALGVPVVPGAGSAAETADEPDQVQGLSITADGDHIVIANDGAMVSVGDNTVLEGNTGDAGASGAIAVDVDGSEVTSGDSQVAGPAPTDLVSPWSGVVPGVWTPTQYPVADPAGMPYAASADPTPAPGSRSISLAGYENRALDVFGHDNLLTYDDSNLFFDRIGNFYGNTGDTDSSGLNVVDAARSRVASGDSGISGGMLPLPLSAYGGLWPSPYGVLPPPPTGGWSASVADRNGVSTATAQDSLVIGGDGLHDEGVSLVGDHNVATKDDGNVAVGGAGDVRAQVGDSDTSGAVVMGVLDSDISSGSSVVPAGGGGPGW